MSANPKKTQYPILITELLLSSLGCLSTPVKADEINTKAPIVLPAKTNLDPTEMLTDPMIHAKSSSPMEDSIKKLNLTARTTPQKHIHTQPITSIVTGSIVNFRKGPSTKHEILLQVKKGDVLLVKGCTQKWLQVSYKGHEGWIYGEYVRFTEKNPAVDTSIEDPQNLPTQTQSIGYVTSSIVNIRRGPGTNYKILSQASRGKKVTILSKSGKWYFISYLGVSGWMHSNHINSDISIPNKDKIQTTPVKPVKEAVTGTSGMRNKVASHASKFIGTPYKYGGTDLTRGVDCSGFILSIMSQFDIHVPRTSLSQSKFGQPVNKSELLPGDLVFFDTRKKMTGTVSHVGLYIGDGKIIHAGSKGVVINTLDQNYYKNRYVKARRVF